MKKISLIFLIALWNLFLFESISSATLTNPSSDTLFDDDGTEIFTPKSLVWNLELLDIGGYFGPAEFGFFFAGTDPTMETNRTTIFGKDDQYYLGGVLQMASINFNTRIVRDLNDWSIEDSFTGSGNIGFYYMCNPNPIGGIDLPPLALYSLSDYNGGTDYVGTFRSKNLPNTYLLGFEIPETYPVASGIPVAFAIVSGVSPVPEPSTLLLLGSGLAGLIPLLRKKR